MWLGKISVANFIAQKTENLLYKQICEEEGLLLSKQVEKKMPYKKPSGKKEIISEIKDKIKVGGIKTAKKIRKGYIKHYSNYFSELKSAQFEIGPRVISKIIAYKRNILRHFKEVYKNEHE